MAGGELVNKLNSLELENKNLKKGKTDWLVTGLILNISFGLGTLTEGKTRQGNLFSEKVHVCHIKRS
jgi:hypothetical protein